MDKTLLIIDDQIQMLEVKLSALRDAYDRANANNAGLQVIVAQDIAVVTAQIQILKHLQAVIQAVP